MVTNFITLALLSFENINHINMSVRKFLLLSYGEADIILQVSYYAIYNVCICNQLNYGNLNIPQNFKQNMNPKL